jgi:hypothetical protein
MKNPDGASRDSSATTSDAGPEGLASAAGAAILTMKSEKKTSLNLCEALALVRLGLGLGLAKLGLGLATPKEEGVMSLASPNPPIRCGANTLAGRAAWPKREKDMLRMEAYARRKTARLKNQL